MAVYLDHAAGAPLLPAAREAMMTFLDAGPGNPSGSHSAARAARAALEDARDVVADFCGVMPGEVVFTSGGTEADNLAVLGGLAGRDGAVVVSVVEHPAVIEAARASGREVRVIPVDGDGVVDIDGMRAVLRAGPVALVSLQAANHETGVIQDLPMLLRRARRLAPRAVLHTDAVAAAPWLDLRTVTEGADLISISGHKFGGPAGSGAVAVRNSAVLRPLVHGGGQERERRAGTQNVAAAVGMAAAISCLSADPGVRMSVAERRDRLANAVLEAVPFAVQTSTAAERLPGHCHFRFPGIESEALLFVLDQSGVCASAGAACASGAIEPSPVLLAMGVPRQEAGSALRMTLGADTTDADVAAAAAAVAAAVRRLAGVAV